MHTFGHPVDIQALLEVANRHKLCVIEDAAESLGSTIDGRHTGTFGALATLSFNGNKTVTTGGGGAILTNDHALATRAKFLTTTAKSPHKWAYYHPEIGYNYRLPNVNAALGCAQLEQLPGFLAAKRELHCRYRTAFANVDQVTLFSEPAGCRSNYWLQTILLDESVASMRDAILTATNDAGLMTRPAWTLLHTLPAYEACPRAHLPISESLERCIINIPSSVNLV
jgi:perosamine synthetase